MGEVHSSEYAVPYAETLDAYKTVLHFACAAAVNTAKVLKVLF